MALGSIGTSEVLAATYAVPPGPPGGLDPVIPGPTDVLGPWVLERPATSAEIWTYADALAAATPLVQIHEYGRTCADSRLAYVTIGARSPAEANATATVWIGAGIHGDEPSGSDAAMVAMYRLAAGVDSETSALREGLVVHIDPLANPDGRERFLAGTAVFGAQQVSLDPDDLASVGPWPRGRGNHYLFDLNRDLILQTQPETRARVAAMRRVDPDLVLELHEMEHHDSFLFASPGEPLNPHLPEHVHRWWERLAGAHGACLDGLGVAWYRGEWNEVFYPGYQDIWPAYSGAVPVIFEQGRTGPTAVRLHDGRVRTYAEAVRNQAASIFANLRAVAADPVQLRGDVVSSRRSNERPDNRAYVVPITTANQQRARWLADCLSAQGIETFVEREHAAPLPPTCLVIPLGQPLAALVRVLLEPEVAMHPEFVKAERARLEACQAGVLYDVTAWSPALAAGLDVDLRTDGLPSASAPPTNWTAVAEKPGVLPTCAFGYLFHDDGFRMVGAALHAGLHLRVGMDPLRCDGRSWPAGTALVRADEQRLKNVREILQDLASRHGVEVIAVQSAAVSEGPDLGGRRFISQRPPAIGILAGPGISEPSFGSVRHLVDVELGIPAAVIDPPRHFGNGPTDLNVVVVPEFVGPEPRDVIGPSAAAHLREWVIGGGTLITMGRSAGLTGELRIGETCLDRGAVRWLPTGAFLNVDVDVAHFFALGVEPSIPALWRGAGVLVPGPAAHVVARLAPAPLLRKAGLVWDEAITALAGTPYLTVETVGRGRVVIFGSEPLWRGAARSTSRLLVRALTAGETAA